MPPTAIAGQVDISHGKAHPFQQHPFGQNVDFFTDHPYMIVFENPTVFGMSQKSLRRGHNVLHVAVDRGETNYWLQQIDENAAITNISASASSVQCNSTGVAVESMNMSYATSALVPTGNILVP